MIYALSLGRSACCAPGPAGKARQQLSVTELNINLDLSLAGVPHVTSVLEWHAFVTLSPRMKGLLVSSNLEYLF